MKRRAFLKTVGSAAGAAALGVPMAANRQSIFLNEEKQVAVNHPHGNPSYPANAHAELPA